MDHPKAARVGQARARLAVFLCDRAGCAPLNAVADDRRRTILKSGERVEWRRGRRPRPRHTTAEEVFGCAVTGPFICLSAGHTRKQTYVSMFFRVTE